MPEFNIRSDSIDVEKIMEQVRARIREKRGVDYTEDQIRDLATVKLERFLDPKNVRSDLLEHYRKQYDQPAAAAPSSSEPGAAPSSETVALPPFEPVTVHPFEPDVVYQSSRAGVGSVLQVVRRTLRPFLKLLFNPGPILETLRALSAHAANTNRALLAHDELHRLNEERHRLNEERHRLNEARHKARAELDVLTYEVLNNLVVEMTRLAIDMKNHKMRVESVAARLDFDERRARALEEVVQYRESAAKDGTTAGETAAPNAEQGAEGAPEKRRRRRRRGRRRSGSEAGTAATDATAGASSGSGTSPQAETAGGTDAASATASADGASAAGEDAGAADTGAPGAAASPGDDVTAPASQDAAPSGVPSGREAPPATAQPATAADPTPPPGGKRTADSTDS